MNLMTSAIERLVETRFGKSVRKLTRPAYLRIMNMLPTQTRVAVEHLRAHGHLPDLVKPRTLNEKIVWRKLYDRDPRFPILADKIRSKEWIAQKYGASLIIPTIAIFASADDIDFDRLPLPFVMKANHGSQMNIIVKAAPFDHAAIRKKAARFLATDFSSVAQEWAYSPIVRKLLVEPFIQTPAGYLADYKFHVIGGRVRLIECGFGDQGLAFCDREFNRVHVQLRGYPVYPEVPVRPQTFTQMVELAEVIGSDFPYVRVDLYEVEQCVKFGELTFYSGAGHEAFVPREWDDILGAYWKQDFSVRQCAPATPQGPKGQAL